MVSRGFISTRYLREKQSLRIYSLGIRCFLFFFFFFYLIAFPKNRIHNYSLTPLGVWNFWIQDFLSHNLRFKYFQKSAFRERIQNLNGVNSQSLCHTNARKSILLFPHRFYQEFLAHNSVLSENNQRESVTIVSIQLLQIRQKY